MSEIKEMIRESRKPKMAVGVKNEAKTQAREVNKLGEERKVVPTSKSSGGSLMSGSNLRKVVG